MTITPEDQARWNLYGTNQQDALKAGTIYGGPLSGSSESMKTSYEQLYANFRHMDERRAAEIALLAKGVSSGAPLNVSLSKFDRVVLKMLLIAAVLAALMVLLLIGTGAMLSPNTTGIDRKKLSADFQDPSFYVNRDAEVVAMSKRTASELLNKHFIGQSNWNWSNLSGVQRTAVQGMWLRYMRNPKAFLAMENHHQRGALRLFDSYLLALGDQSSSAMPYIDRGRLYLSGLDPINIPYTARGSRARSAWFEGALALPNNPELEALSQGGSWDVKAYQQMIRGWHAWKGLLPRSIVPA